MSATFGVGLVGLEAGRSWGAVAHLPALRALAEHLRIVGVANSSLASAQVAADACGLPRAFASVDEMVSCPEIDIVVVTVKVPHHAAIVHAALDAGKHVYCEWPLGNGLAEANAMAAHAVATKSIGLNLVTVCGMQARVSPALTYVRDLISEGYIGELLSTSVIGNANSAGPTVEQANAYTLDVTNGATMATIPLGHTLAVMADIIGPLAEVSAHIDTRRRSVRVVETGVELTRTAPDQVVLAGKLASGSAVSVHYRGGSHRGSGLLWAFNGTKGDIQVTAPFGHTQIADLVVRGATGSEMNLRELAVPESYGTSGKVSAHVQNVYLMYQRMLADLRHGTHTTPSFADAVRVHEVLAAIELSAATGTRVKINATSGG
ncbi:MAG: Gfo/Idh/MocA family oxidoreductase [Oxalobacteraceae bacterium]|nr:MAG: Gfo/Idh/MocA family oxidoreductase [Oxalobacteraceae bacterium]